MSRTRFFAVLVVFLAAAAGRADEPAKVGDRAGKLRFTDIRSLPRTLDDFAAKKAFVLAFTNTSCPIVQRYLPVLQSLEKEYRGKGVQFIAVNSASEDTLIAAATQAVKFEIEFPIVKDFGAACARALGVTRTPEVVVLDGERRVRYRGRIDDQYRLRGHRKEASAHELVDAIDAVLAGKPVAVPETEVDGCLITFPKPRQPRDVTYAEHVAPILARHCWECHRDGASAPFALTSFKQAAARADAIAEVVADQRMPPWFAAHDFGPFVNRRGLSDEERAAITDWARDGAPAGDLSKAPEPPAPFRDRWRIGTPDLVLDSKVFDLPATGDIPYQYAILMHPFAQDTWVQGVEITSDNPRALHHCNLAFVKITEGFNPDNFITGYVPGGEPMNLDNGVGFLIPKGSVLGLQIHFVSTGKPEKAKVSVGLRYPREVIQKQLRCMQIFDTRFAIPPHSPAHKVAGSGRLDKDAIGVGLFAHMHLRGKDMTFTAHTPAGPPETLLIIPNYSFSWQIPYRWEPGKKLIPGGTRLECVAHFDNSEFNPFNPDPKKTVRNGPQTHQEMMYGFFFYTHANEKLGIQVDPKDGTVRSGQEGRGKEEED
jgi:thiol-disulfide isomerase/thioredoxin